MDHVPIVTIIFVGSCRPHFGQDMALKATPVPQDLQKCFPITAQP